MSKKIFYATLSMMSVLALISASLAQTRLPGGGRVIEPPLSLTASLDPAFGVGGKLTTDFGFGRDDQALALTIQPDGRIVVAGRAKDLKEGVVIGKKSLDSGAAAQKLDHLIAVSNA